jgi:hypothetical protein
MEYNDTNIHSEDDVVAKIRPNASTLKAKSISGKRLNHVHWIGPSVKTIELMELIVKKSNTLPMSVQLSLRFGRLLDTKIRKATIIGTRTAKSGLYSMPNIPVIKLTLRRIAVTAPRAPQIE